MCAVHPDAPFDYSEKAALLPQDLLFKAYVDQWLHQRQASGALAAALQRWLAYPWEVEPLRQLIDQRLALMEDVARHKWNTGTPIEDLARERQLILSLGDKAAAVGVPAALAERFFRAQIDAAKTLQQVYFEKWEKDGRGSVGDAPDLDKEIRPRLDAMTAKLLQALANARPYLESSDTRRATTPLLPLRAATISPAAATQAMAPIASGHDRQ